MMQIRKIGTKKGLPVVAFLFCRECGMEATFKIRRRDYEKVEYMISRLRCKYCGY